MKYIMKVGFLMCFCALLVFAGKGFCADRPMKIGYVNLEKVFNAYNKTQSSKVDFEKEKDAQQKEISKKQEELQKLQEEYEKNKDLLKPEEKTKKEEEIKSKSQVLYTDTMKASQALEEKRMGLINTLVGEIKDKIKNFARSEKYDLILDAQIVLSGPEGADLTNAIIEFVNKK
jgi:outer membrane protein